jgi:hypothetical protein
MHCDKCNCDNRSDAEACQQCGAPLRPRQEKVVVLRRIRSGANSLPGREFASYYIWYASFGFAGGLVVAVAVFLLFLFICDCLGVTDPAGSTLAVLVLLALEIAVLSVYGAFVVSKVKVQIGKARHRLPWYRRNPGARR